MSKAKYPKGWVKLSKKDKAEFVRQCNAPSSTPTMFNLKSDKDDCGGRFDDLTPHQVVKSAKESARFLKRNYLGSTP